MPITHAAPVILWYSIQTELRAVPSTPVSAETSKHSALVPSAGADGRETSEGPELVQRLGLVRLVTVSAYRSCRRPQDQTE